MTQTPKIEKLSWRLIEYPLPGTVGGSGVAKVDVITCQIHAQGGLSGFGFSYAIGGRGYASAVAGQALAKEVLDGQAIPHPETAWAKVRRLCNRTGMGPNYVGYAAADVALWDLYAKLLNLPLAGAMGGAARAVPVYGSGGYKPGQPAELVTEQVEQHLAQGFGAIKLRLAGNPSDQPILHAAADALGAKGWLMADLNEKTSLPQARYVLDQVQAHGGLFVEEPLPSTNIAGYRALRESHGGMVATGEHFQGLEQARGFIADGLCATIQPDLAMIGGLTETLRILRVAEAFGCELTPHFLPGLFVHLAATSPALTWLEDFPLLEPLFDGWPSLAADGTLSPDDRPGHGLSLSDFGIELETRNL